jgi:hypothetical protein
MAEQTPPIDSREWLVAALDEGGRRLKMARDAGATSPEVCWAAGDVQITAKQHRDGVTLTTRAGDGTVPVADMMIPASWLHPDLNGAS